MENKFEVLNADGSTLRILNADDKMVPLLFASGLETIYVRRTEVGGVRMNDGDFFVHLWGDWRKLHMSLEDLTKALGMSLEKFDPEEAELA